MAVFYIGSASDTTNKYFNTDFYVQLKLEATKNEIENTFTFSVKGARYYAGANIYADVPIYCKLSKTPIEFDKDEDEPKDIGELVCTISAAKPTIGYYKGWFPREQDGQNGEKLAVYKQITGSSLTCNVDTSGKCPPVYIYFGCSKRVTNQSNGKLETGTSVHYGDISYLLNDLLYPSFETGYPKVTPESSNSIAYEIRVNTHDELFDVLVKNNTNGISKSHSSNVSGGTIKGTISANSSSNSIYILCTKKNNQKSCESNFTIDCSVPDITFNIKPTGLRSARGYLKCKTHDYVYKVDNADNWSEKNDKNTESIIYFSNLQNTNHSHTAQVKRYDCDITSAIVSRNIDMRVPSLSNISIEPTSSTEGILKYTCDLSGTAYWYVEGRSTPLKTWSITGDSNAIRSETVILQSNGISSGSYEYTLKVVRDTYDVLYTTEYVSANTNTNDARITNVTSNGTTLEVFTKVEGAHLDLLEAQLVSGKTVLPAPEEYVTGVATEIPGVYKFEFTNVPVNKTFEFVLTITNSLSGLITNKSLSNDGLVCRGVIYICTHSEADGANPQWLDGTTYTYTSSGWKSGAPYICISNIDGDNPEWEYGHTIS